MCDTLGSNDWRNSSNKMVTNVDVVVADVIAGVKLHECSAICLIWFTIHFKCGVDK